MSEQAQMPEQPDDDEALPAGGGTGQPLGGDGGDDAFDADEPDGDDDLDGLTVVDGDEELDEE